MLNCWQAEPNESSPLIECHEYGLLCPHSWCRCLVQWISGRVASWGQISACLEIIQQWTELGSYPPAPSFVQSSKKTFTWGNIFLPLLGLFFLNCDIFINEKVCLNAELFQHQRLLFCESCQFFISSAKNARKTLPNIISLFQEFHVFWVSFTNVGRITTLRYQPESAVYICICHEGCSLLFCLSFKESQGLVVSHKQHMSHIVSPPLLLCVGGLWWGDGATWLLLQFLSFPSSHSATPSLYLTSSVFYFSLFIHIYFALRSPLSLSWCCDTHFPLGDFSGRAVLESGDQLVLKPKPSDRVQQLQRQTNTL